MTARNVERRPVVGTGAQDELNATTRIPDSGPHLSVIDGDEAARAEQVQALDVARYLAESGVPIFLARPALVGGQWQPTGGTGGTGYWLPGGWQQTQPDPAALDVWRPGMAVCAVMGHVVDGADVDPRHGGQETFSGLQGAGMWPQSYGRQETPSGGFHELVARLDVASRDNVRPGLDVKAGLDDGTGRGFLFLAPTVKRSKSTGQVGAYRWTVEPNLGDLLDGLVDESGLALAEMVQQERAPKATTAATEPWSAVTATRSNPHEGVAAWRGRETAARERRGAAAAGRPVRGLRRRGHHRRATADGLGPAAGLAGGPGRAACRAGQRPRRGVAPTGERRRHPGRLGAAGDGEPSGDHRPVDDGPAGTAWARCPHPRP